LLQAIEDYHASYATVHWYPREFLTANRDLVDRINMRLGYRLQLVEASWPAEVKTAGAMALGYAWRNAGVAPCLPGGYPAITLKDAQGGIAGVFVDDDFSVRELPVGPPDQAMIISRKELGPKTEENDKPLHTFTLPPAQILKPGTYDLYISVGTATGEPVLALPLASDDGHRRYRLGSIKQGGSPPAGTIITAKAQLHRALYFSEKGDRRVRLPVLGEEGTCGCGVKLGSIAANF
jgi:hypothetical protein